MKHEAALPSRATAGAVGYDIASCERIVVEPRGQKLIHTALMVMPPTGHYLRLATRSSMALRGLSIRGGVIDPDYRGELKVILYNSSREPYRVEVGQRVAQMICERYTLPAVLEVNELPPTGRGSGGFGSTGS